MLVREKMIIAIFIRPVAFGAVPEFQAGIIQFCSSADSAFMPRAVIGGRAGGPHALMESGPSADLLRADTSRIPR